MGKQYSPSPFRILSVIVLMWIGEFKIAIAATSESVIQENRTVSSSLLQDRPSLTNGALTLDSITPSSFGAGAKIQLMGSPFLPYGISTFFMKHLLRYGLVDCLNIASGNKCFRSTHLVGGILHGDIVVPLAAEGVNLTDDISGEEENSVINATLSVNSNTAVAIFNDIEIRQFDLSEDFDSATAFIDDLIKMGPIYSGGLSGNLSLDLDSNSNFNRHFRPRDRQLEEPNGFVTINPSLSSWTLSTSGQVDIAFILTSTEDGKSIELSDIHACSSGCGITIKENETVVGKLDTTIGPIRTSGNIRLNLKHIETYSGHMDTVRDAQNKPVLKWSSDLEVRKTDERSWEHEITESNEVDHELLKRWEWKKQITSGATVYPARQIEGNEEKTFNQHIVNHFSLKQYFESDPAAMDLLVRPYPVKTYTLHSDKEESINSIILPYPKDVQSQSGIASFALVDSYGNAHAFSGYYKNDGSADPFIDYATESAEPLIGLYIDPFEFFMAVAGDYYFNSEIPGFTPFSGLTRTNFGQTVISAPPIHVLPKNIVVFSSFKSEDPRFKPVQDGVNLLLDELRKKNAAKIQLYKTESRGDFLAALKNVPDGAWLINLGHGAEDGRLLAGDELVSQLEIEAVLKSRNVRLDIFTAKSCFGGRASFADLVLGAFSYGISDYGDGGNIAGMVGVGYNGFNQTRDSFLALLRTIVDQCESGQCPKPYTDTQANIALGSRPDLLSTFSSTLAQ